MLGAGGSGEKPGLSGQGLLPAGLEPTAGQRGKAEATPPL